METLMLIDDDPGIRRMLGLLIREHSLGRWSASWKAVSMRWKSCSSTAPMWC